MSEQSLSPKLQVFDRLQAEYETAWQDQVFVPPSFMDFVTGMRSCVVFGASGMGKTILAQQLVRYGTANGTLRQPLVVTWRPSPPQQTMAGSTAMRFYIRQICNRCATTLLEWIATNPSVLGSLSELNLHAFASFAQTFTGANSQFGLGVVRPSNPPQDISVISKILSLPVTSLYTPDSTEDFILNQLTLLLDVFGWQGLWLVMDRLEPWFDTDPSLITENFQSIFSALDLFEHEGFSWKIIAPDNLLPSLMASGGVRRRRVQPFILQWQTEELILIAERRLACALGKSLTLQDLYASPRRRASKSKSNIEVANLADYLKQFGGNSPRAWLDLLRPFVKKYLDVGAARRLTKKEFDAVRRQAAPSLFYDLDNDQVYVGDRLLDGLTKSQRNILRYLYEHRQRTCTKSELFYIAHMEYDKEPRLEDPKWELRRNVENAIDNQILRLRQAIEPDPGDPVYILTVRQKGIWLRNTV